MLVSERGNLRTGYTEPVMTGAWPKELLLSVHSIGLAGPEGPIRVDFAAG
jgi:hypothetical protein